MRKLFVTALVLCVAMSFVFANGGRETSTTSDAPVKNNFHIGVVTGTVSQSEDDLRGAEALIAEYGAVADGGMIQHVTYPDNFMEEQETTIQVITALAADPEMKAIVVNQSVPGTTEAFRQVKEIRPDIITIAGEPHEDPPVIETSADLAVQNDFVNRGFLIINTAHELGCDTFVHISFPRHLSYESMARRVAAMREACNDLGMEFVMVSAPDPTSDVGVAGAQQYILEQTPAWIDQYGTNTAFFCTNDAHTEPLLKQLLEYGGYFIEADLPSPLMGYPGALGIEITPEESGDFAAILAKVENAINEKGGADRFGTWAFSYGYTTTAGLGQHAINVLNGESELTKMSDIMKAYNKYTPGAEWNGSLYTDLNTGVTAPNHVLIYQDTYIMGDPGHFMGNADIEVPAKYATLR